MVANLPSQTELGQNYWHDDILQDSRRRLVPLKETAHLIATSSE